MMHFSILAIEAGADSGIIDPITNNPRHVFAMDRSSTALSTCNKPCFLVAIRIAGLS